MDHGVILLLIKTILKDFFSNPPVLDDNECSPDVVADNCPGVMATPANSTCTNTDGSFLCECKGGYSASVNQEGVTICSSELTIPSLTLRGGDFFFWGGGNYNYPQTD